MNIEAWLLDLGLEQYESAFATHAIDADVLPELTDEDLKEIGIVALGHRRRLLAAIKALQSNASVSRATAETSVSGEMNGERRHIAVLFADLVGYTQLTEALGAEATHDLLNQYFDWLDSIVEHAGGRVDKHIGDCAMGVFGAPVSHGNDAERAVWAALEIRRTLPEIRRRVGREIEVHVGLSIGVVVASYVGSGATAEYAVTGDSVNLASRLCDSADAGEILISDGLHQVLSGRLRCAPAGELTVKGFAAPVKAWRLIELVDRTATPDRLAGRKNEIRQFETVLRACESDGTGQAIVLRGEAGIGKTRLSEEFENIAQRRHFATHRGLVLDFGGETGRDALRVIMRELLGLSSPSSRDELVQAVQHAVEAGVVAKDLQVHLNVLVDAPQSEDLRSLYNAMDDERRTFGRARAMEQLLSWATRQKPRLLIVEDVHWAKPPLLRALAQLSQFINRRAAVLVFTTRPEGDPFDRNWRSLVGETAFTTFDLKPLTIRDAKVLCQAVLARENVYEELIERADGNPLFLKQLLLYHATGNAAGVPGTIQSLVQATIDQLGPEDKALIQTASVIGQRVDPALLEDLVGMASPDTSSLIEKNLLRPQGQELLFVHALIRDAVYESLLSKTRKALHLRAAEWFANRDHRLHAEHLALAGSPKTPSAFLVAARHEAGEYHYETALALIEKGLAHEPATRERFALQMLAGETWHDFGRMSEAAEAFAQALGLASTPLERCEVLIGQAGVKRVIEDSDGALKDLEQAEATADSEELLVERSRINFLRGNLLFPRGDIDGCMKAHRQALELARAAKRLDLQAAALGGLGDAEYMRGNMAWSRRTLGECVALARQEKLERTAVANEAQIAHTLIYTASQRDAYEAARKAIETAHRIGHLRAEINARAAVIKALSDMARDEECLAEVEACDQLVERLGTARFRQELLMLGSKALAGLGRHDEALERIQEGLAFAHQTGFSFHGPAVASCYALLEPDPHRKLELLAEAEDGIAQGCVGHNQFRVYADGIDVAFALKSPQRLTRYIALMEGYPAEDEVSWSRFHAARGRALLKRLEHGDGEETATALYAVQEEVERLEMWAWSVADLLG